MPFDWREYLELARELSKIRSPTGHSQEAFDRSAVSRAYYAAFCWVRNYAEQRLGFKPTKKPEDHSRLRQHLQNIGRTELAATLDDLRKWRNACDYDDEVQNLHQMVSDSIRLADEIIKECK